MGGGVSMQDALKKIIDDSLAKTMLELGLKRSKYFC